MQEVSEAFVLAAWRGKPEPVAQLVTIRAEEMATPITVTDWPGGLVSNGVKYAHYPFQLAWAAASRDQPFGSGRLTIANVDRRIEEACEGAATPPALDLAVVKVSAPNVIERAVTDARIPSAEGDETRVTATIRPRDFSEEPACAVSFTPDTAPGMF